MRQVVEEGREQKQGEAIAPAAMRPASVVWTPASSFMAVCENPPVVGYALKNAPAMLASPRPMSSRLASIS
jgi:hypothetical protein